MIQRANMFRPAFRTLPRAVPRAARRTLTTLPPHEAPRRSLKNKTLRLALAGSLVYWYNTSSVFAEEPAYAVAAPPETSRENETYDTIDSIAEQRRAQARAQQAASKPEVANARVAAPDAEVAAPGGPEQLEEEAGQQGAFNEETGEINWDCPCLGGMAHGPCGEQFRTAFSCFVFSKDEPKGVDCIEHFKGMQDCFREHPEIYGAELDDDEMELAQASENAAAARQADDGAQASMSPASSPREDGEKVAKPYGQEPRAQVESKNERASAAAAQVKEQHAPVSESKELVPKAWHDASDASTEK